MVRIRPTERKRIAMLVALFAPSPVLFIWWIVTGSSMGELLANLYIGLYGVVIIVSTLRSKSRDARGN